MFLIMLFKVPPAIKLRALNQKKHLIVGLIYFVWSRFRKIKIQLIYIKQMLMCILKPTKPTKQGIQPPLGTKPNL